MAPGGQQLRYWLHRSAWADLRLLFDYFGLGLDFILFYFLFFSLLFLISSDLVFFPPFFRSLIFAVLDLDSF